MYAEFCNMAPMLQVNTGRKGKRRGQRSGENTAMAAKLMVFQSPWHEQSQTLSVWEGQKGMSEAHGWYSWNGCEVGLEHRAKLGWAGDFQTSHRTVSVVCGSILLHFLYLCFYSWANDFGEKSGTTLECFPLDPGRCPPRHCEWCCRQPLELLFLPSLMCPTLVLLRMCLEQEIAQDNS